MQSGTSVYLLTSRNTLMPAVFLGEVAGRNGLSLYEVQSPQGRVYSCNPNNVFDEDAGRVMLAHARAEQMAAEGYEITCRNDGSYRVYHAGKHGAKGGYIVREVQLGNLVCECPATEKNACCKHVQAVCSLLHNKAKRAAGRGWKPGQVRYENLAVRVASDHWAAETTQARRERVLADMARDF